MLEIPAEIKNPIRAIALQPLIQQQKSNSLLIACQKNLSCLLTVYQVKQHWKSIEFPKGIKGYSLMQILYGMQLAEAIWTASGLF